MIKHHRRRSGFTLIEIMIVLAIISLLIALSIAGVMRVQMVQQIRTSSDIVEKVQVAADNQFKAIIAQASMDCKVPSNGPPDVQAVFSYCGGDPDRTLSLVTYCRVRQSFPQVFSEVGTFTISGLGYTYPVKSQFQPFVGATAPAGLQSAWQQSAILLYAAVAQTGAGGSVFTSDATNAAINQSFQLGTGTYTVYMDAWKQPVGFCRFGTNNELQGAPYANTKTTLLDPFDPSGKLQTWSNTTALSNATVVFLNNGDAANATSFNGTNRRLVVYSVGYNLGYESLNMTQNTTPGKAALDDILGYRLTQIGQRPTQ